MVSEALASIGYTRSEQSDIADQLTAFTLRTLDEDVPITDRATIEKARDAVFVRAAQWRDEPATIERLELPPMLTFSEQSRVHDPAAASVGDGVAPKDEFDSMPVRDEDLARAWGFNDQQIATVLARIADEGPGPLGSIQRRRNVDRIMIESVRKAGVQISSLPHTERNGATVSIFRALVARALAHGGASRAERDTLFDDLLEWLHLQTEPGAKPLWAAIDSQEAPLVRETKERLAKLREASAAGTAEATSPAGPLSETKVGGAYTAQQFADAFGLNPNNGKLLATIEAELEAFQPGYDRGTELSAAAMGLLIEQQDVSPFLKEGAEIAQELARAIHILTSKIAAPLEWVRATYHDGQRTPADDSPEFDALYDALKASLDKRLKGVDDIQERTRQSLLALKDEKLIRTLESAARRINTNGVS